MSIGALTSLLDTVSRSRFNEPYAWHKWAPYGSSDPTYLATTLKLTLRQHCALELLSGFLNALADQVKAIGGETRGISRENKDPQGRARRFNTILGEISDILVEEALVSNVEEANAIVIPPFAWRGLLPTRDGRFEVEQVKGREGEEDTVNFIKVWPDPVPSTPGDSDSDISEPVITVMPKENSRGRRSRTKTNIAELRAKFVRPEKAMTTADQDHSGSDEEDSNRPRSATHDERKESSPHEDAALSSTAKADFVHQDAHSDKKKEDHNDHADDTEHGDLQPDEPNLIEAELDQLSPDVPKRNDSDQDQPGYGENADDEVLNQEGTENRGP